MINLMSDQDRLRQDYGREGFYAFTEAIDHTQYKVLTNDNTIQYNCHGQSQSIVINSHGDRSSIITRIDS